VYNSELSTGALVSDSRAVDHCGQRRAPRNRCHAGRIVRRPQSTGVITSIGSKHHEMMTTSPSGSGHSSFISGRN